MQYAPATHWDQVFCTFRQRGEDLDWGEQWTGAFAPILHTHHVQNLLDLGCGTGNDVLRLTQHGYTVVGLDHSREAVHQAATKAASRAAFLVADMAAPLPLADACFDAVMSNVAMHFFDDARTRALFAEVRRVLRPSGGLSVPRQCPGRPATPRQAQTTSARNRAQLHPGDGWENDAFFLCRVSA